MAVPTEWGMLSTLDSLQLPDNFPFLADLQASGGRPDDMLPAAGYLSFSMGLPPTSFKTGSGASPNHYYALSQPVATQALNVSSPQLLLDGRSYQHQDSIHSADTVDTVEYQEAVHTSRPLTRTPSSARQAAAKHVATANADLPKRKVGRPISYKGDPNNGALTEDERRRLKRRIANRESARRVRRRRQTIVAGMDTTLQSLQDQNGQLCGQLADFENQRAILMGQRDAMRDRWTAVAADNARLVDENMQLRRALQLAQQPLEPLSEPLMSPFMHGRGVAVSMAMADCRQTVPSSRVVTTSTTGVSGGLATVSTPILIAAGTTITTAVGHKSRASASPAATAAAGAAGLLTMVQTNSSESGASAGTPSTEPPASSPLNPAPSADALDWILRASSSEVLRLTDGVGA